MAINFPNNPAPNDTHTANAITWRFDGVAWVIDDSAFNDVYVNKAGDTMTGDLTVLRNGSAESGIWLQNGAGESKLYTTSNGDLALAEFDGLGVLVREWLTIIQGAGLLVQENITVTRDPVAALELVTMQYADNIADNAEPPLGDPVTDGEILSSTSAGVRSWVERFFSSLFLTDTPGGYGAEGEALVVNPTLDGLVYALVEATLGNPTTDGDILASTIAGVRSWVSRYFDSIDLTDTPAGYGAVGEALVVNGTTDGYIHALLEAALGNPTTDGDILSSTIAGVRSWVPRFFTLLDLTDTPGVYGTPGQVLVVNPLANGYDHADPGGAIAEWLPGVLQPVEIIDTDWGNTTITPNGNGNTLSNTSLVDPTLAASHVASMGLSVFQPDATERGHYVSPQNELFVAAGGGGIFLIFSDGNGFTGTPPASWQFGFQLVNSAANQWTCESLTNPGPSYIATDAEIVAGNIGYSVSYDGVNVTLNLYLSGNPVPVFTSVEAAAGIGYTGQIGTVGLAYQVGGAINTSYFSVDTPAAFYPFTQITASPILDPGTYPADGTYYIDGLAQNAGSVLGEVWNGVLWTMLGGVPTSRNNDDTIPDLLNTNNIFNLTNVFAGDVEFLGKFDNYINLAANDYTVTPYDLEYSARYLFKIKSGTPSGLATLPSESPSFLGDPNLPIVDVTTAGRTGTMQINTDNGANFWQNGVDSGSNAYVMSTGKQATFIKAGTDSGQTRWHIIEGVGGGGAAFDNDSLENYNANNGIILTGGVANDVSLSAQGGGDIAFVLSGGGTLKENGVSGNLFTNTSLSAYIAAGAVSLTGGAAQAFSLTSTGGMTLTSSGGNFRLYGAPELLYDGSPTAPRFKVGSSRLECSYLFGMNFTNESGTAYGSINTSSYFGLQSNNGIDCHVRNQTTTDEIVILGGAKVTIGTSGLGGVELNKTRLIALKSGTIASPPTGLAINEPWEDTTDSVTHPILRIANTTT